VIYGSDHRDGPRLCRHCGLNGPHLFLATTVVERSPSEPLAESHTVRCETCRATYAVEGDERPDYGVDELGWVCARRELPAPPDQRATVRPPAFAGAAL
jgi:hypothetical protein